MGSSRKTSCSRVLDKVEQQSGRSRPAINPGEGAFYGPKLEYVLRDAIGRDWQCGTTQVDFNLPARFGAFYIGPDSDKVTPVMIHRAMLRLAGAFHSAFCSSITPATCRCGSRRCKPWSCTITQDGDDYAMEMAAAARKAGLRTEMDLRNEKITYKVREHSLAKVPVLLVVGKREALERTVSIRRFGSQAQTSMSMDEALRMLADEGVAPDVKRG